MKSECIYEIIHFPKHHRNNLIDFCPESLFKLGMLSPHLSRVALRIIQTNHKHLVYIKPSRAEIQARIYLLRIYTIPNHNHEMRLLFPIFRLIFFFILVTKSHDKQTTYLYICMYVMYSQLVFRPFTPKKCVRQAVFNFLISDGRVWIYI